MFNVKYAVPYWWKYKLFEVVPIGMCVVWDGCGTIAVNEQDGFIWCGDEPISLDKKLNSLQEVINDLALWASAGLDDRNVCKELKAIFLRVIELDSSNPYNTNDSTPISN